MDYDKFIEQCRKTVKDFTTNVEKSFDLTDSGKPTIQEKIHDKTDYSVSFTVEFALKTPGFPQKAEEVLSMKPYNPDIIYTIHGTFKHPEDLQKLVNKIKEVYTK